MVNPAINAAEVEAGARRAEIEVGFVVKVGENRIYTVAVGSLRHNSTSLD
ncbi:hypothetical protein LCGC14_2759760, partial [marine sediment metagenome]